MSYKVGDLVRVKSGGPEMCVESIVLQDMISATWFKPYDLSKPNSWFPVAALRPADAAEVPWSEFNPNPMKMSGEDEENA